MLKKILLPLFLVSIILPCKGFWGFRSDVESKELKKGKSLDVVESKQSKERMMKRHREMEKNVKETNKDSKKMQRKMRKKSRKEMKRSQKKRARVRKQMDKKSRKKRPRRKKPERALETDKKEFEEYRDIDRPYL